MSTPKLFRKIKKHTLRRPSAWRRCTWELSHMLYRTNNNDTPLFQFSYYIITIVDAFFVGMTIIFLNYHLVRSNTIKNQRSKYMCPNVLEIYFTFYLSMLDRYLSVFFLNIIFDQTIPFDFSLICFRHLNYVLRT